MVNNGPTGDIHWEDGGWQLNHGDLGWRLSEKKCHHDRMTKHSAQSKRGTVIAVRKVRRFTVRVFNDTLCHRSICNSHEKKQWKRQ